MRSWFRAGLLGIAIAGMAGLQAPSGMAATSAARPNRIVLENRHPGTDHWQLPWDGYIVADDIGLQVKGFATTTTAQPGDSIGLKVTVTPAQNFTVDVFRLGWYGGTGGRHMEHLGPYPGIHQPDCVSDPTTRMLSCSKWSTSVNLQVPNDWASGVYVAVFSTDDKFQSLTPFWVVDPPGDSHQSDLLFVSSVNTYQAYNNYPYDPPPNDPEVLPLTGHSLYDFNSADSTPAVKVSFDRPYNSQYGGPGDGGLYDFEPELIAFLERWGYDVSYTNDLAVDQHPSTLLDHQAVVIGGHAEYWTMAEYNTAEKARAEGVGLAFISANEIYWQVRYEQNRRVMVGYKDWEPDPYPDPRFWTIKWRDLGRPEQLLIGVQLPTNGFMDWGGQDLVPQNTSSWVYAGSHLSDGVPVHGELVGYEIDSYDPTVGQPPGTDYQLLAASPFVNFEGQTYVHNSSIYRGGGGNWVWATGSMDWAWALSPGGSSDGTLNNVRPRLEFVTRTVLDRMIEDANRSA
jgi:N,N-dimethylformamidase beta subunit-like protein